MKVKRKVILEEGESCAVYPYETWQVLVDTFNMLARQYDADSEEAAGWHDLAQNLSEQVDSSYNAFEEDE